PNPLARDRPHAPSREVLEILLAAIIFALFARTFLFQAFVVPSPSMEETLLVGDHLIVNKFAYAPHGRILTKLLPYREVRRGDVIVSKFPKEPGPDYINRVVGLPGDTVEFIGETVFVNRHAVKPIVGQSASSAGETAAEPAIEPLRVPAEEYFAMGDNR